MKISKISKFSCGFFENVLYKKKYSSVQKKAGCVYSMQSRLSVQKFDSRPSIVNYQLSIRANVEFSQCNGRNERKRGSAHQNTQPPRSGTAVLMGGFPLGACFCNYSMH
ncbi:MAG: hypothetical protein IJ717_11180, partial [Treponema sp.]|nr:hypothetical protein [Treponema sp.]